jgi:hypothetical protein
MEFENKGEFNKGVNEREFWKKDSGSEYGQLSKENIEKITQKIPKKASILEIGSGSGLLLEQLGDSGNGYDLTWSYFDEKSHELCKKIVPEEKLIPLDIKKDEIKKYDVIVMKHVLGILDLAKELDLIKKGLSLPLENKVEVWDKVLEKIKNKCKQFVLITPLLKEEIDAKDVIRPIFVPDDILQKLLNKHFKSKELLGVQKGESDKDFNAGIYLLSEPKID